MAARVLIIEDDDGFRAALAMMVKMLGYEAVFPEQGGRASLIRTALLAGDYDLVITDVLMPEMDGLEVIRMLRSVKPGCR
jgi:CheY-like chemotaxis protein